MSAPAVWWAAGKDGRLECMLCPNGCMVPQGGVGMCGARFADGGAFWTRAWGRGTPPVVDPVEKKPLYHFLPGTRTLSFGAVGCNMACAFCQNHHLSAARGFGALDALGPERIIHVAVAAGCASIAFTYNEPIISAEFCIEVSMAAREAGLKTIAVSNGYINGGKDGPRESFFGAMDAANIDLKGISPAFYERHCGARLEPVLETLDYIAASKSTWLEVTNLLIPSLNDSDRDINTLCDWHRAHLGADVPLHFSAFRPAHRMHGMAPTRTETLVSAKGIAKTHDLNHVYLGNTNLPQTTLCPVCNLELIRRVGHGLTHIGLRRGACPACGAAVAGVFENSPKDP